MDNACPLCPHHCRGNQQGWGICGVRQFIDDKWIPQYQGLISALNVDPMEKKPLFHFHPGDKVFSVGFWGCNMKCSFCQNWQISQEKPQMGERLNPRELLQKVKRLGQKYLAFTYNEPLIHYEYILETSLLAKDYGIEIILVTNGMIEPAYAKELLPYISACNVDLKCFSEEGYKSVLKGDLACVKSFIELANNTCHLEITSLIVPGINDNIKEFQHMVQWLWEMNPQSILHLSAYFPAYKYQRESSSEELMETMLSIARKKLHWVYPGNISLDSTSYCPTCGEILIKRESYFIEIQKIHNNRCDHCHSELPFIM
ncbi:MAG: AmmeMemoRadiSam system radical SAM enzyme [Spirochaetaceae bacterium]|jgi:pyruvate formate lyase activating enzyme|nr:AmmeMemoRadiSam system radical SAM enzyme [Spirochaetaceae bacterium]